LLGCLGFGLDRAGFGLNRGGGGGESHGGEAFFACLRALAFMHLMSACVGSSFASAGMSEEEVGISGEGSGNKRRAANDEDHEEFGSWPTNTVLATLYSR